jgi:hypothetical protein
MSKIMQQLYPDVMEKKLFTASDVWLHGLNAKGYRARGKQRRVTKSSLGFKHRFGISFRVPTKKKVDVKDRLLKLRRHQWWLVYKMALPDDPRDSEFDSTYGLYDGEHRLAWDQVPVDMNRCFKKQLLLRVQKLFI